MLDNILLKVRDLIFFQFFPLIVNGVNGEFGQNAAQIVMVGKLSEREKLKYMPIEEDCNARVQA